jgi:hypothetical protein
MTSGPESGDAAEIQFAIAELYHPSIHGKTANSAPNIDSQIICTYSLTCKEFMAGDHVEILDMMRDGYADMFANGGSEGGYPPANNHNSIHSFPRIIIATISDLDSGECVIDRRLDLGIVKLQRLFRKWRGVE